jgi:hypothetical protein
MNNYDNPLANGDPNAPGRDDTSNLKNLQRDRGSLGGQARRYDENGNPIAGSADNATSRAQSMGEAAAARDAYRADYGGYDAQAANAQASRAQGEGAMGLQAAAARGDAPSRAEILGRTIADQSLQAQMSGAASARGGSLAQAAAMRNAASGAAQYSQNANNQIAGMRAEEMAHARDAYAAQANAMRGQDQQGGRLALERSGQETQNEQFQRGLNQQGQQFGEQMGFDIQKQQQQGELAVMGAQNAADQHQKDVNQHSKDSFWDTTLKLGGAAVQGAGGLAAGIKSDEKAKVPANAAEAPGKGASMDWGGIGNAVAGKMGASWAGYTPGTVQRLSDENAKTSVGNGMVVSGGGMDVMGSLKATSDIATQYARDGRAQAVASPMGNMEVSDENGKCGLASAAAQRSGENPAAKENPASLVEMEDANRRQQGYEYSYKPGLAPPEQEPGEVNVGPMAQSLAKNPLTATAVKRDPGTGLLVLDSSKLQKVQSASIASLQAQIDKLKGGKR